MIHLRRIIAAVGLLLMLAGAIAANAQTPAFQAVHDAGIAYINDPGDCPGTISASVLFNELDQWTVLDIRSASHFDVGHIPGARPASLATLLDDVADLPLDTPIAVACYTGQTAGAAKFALEIAGYENVKSLKFGMAAWHASLAGPWDANVGDLLHTIDVTDQNPNLVSHDLPTLDGDPATAVMDRLQAVLSHGFRSIGYFDIEADLDDYFIINYFAHADYMGQGNSGVPGHIPGAFQFTPYASLALDQMLHNIPADMPVVVYCWTGQHSAQLVTYLNMLGYDAYSLRYGVNALFHSHLTAHRWNGNSLELPLETVLDAPQAPSALQVQCYPNPFNPRVSVTAELARPGNTRVGIFDLAGRRVAELAGGHREAGRHTWTWNGRDDGGRAAPTGTYILRVTSGTETAVRKMTLAR